MKKWLTMLLILCAVCLPVMALAETAAELPEGWRVEDFGDFTLPLPPNAWVYRYEKEGNNCRVAEIVSLELDGAFSPYVTIGWYYQNMSEYYKNAHPLRLGRYTVDSLADAYRDAGCTVTDVTTVYGVRRGRANITLGSMNMPEGSPFADEAHELWFYERFEGTYAMGTYFFEVFAPTREQAEEIAAWFDALTFR